MSLFPIQPARWGSAGAPAVQSGVYKTNEAIIKGSLLGIDSDGLLVLLTSDANNPANGSIAGVALEAAESKPGFSVGQTDSASQYTGRVQEVSYAKANRVTEFWGVISADGSTISTPTQTLIGESYKLSKNGDGDWYVDSSDQTPANVVITDIDIESKRVIFKFTEASLVEP